MAQAVSRRPVTLEARFVPGSVHVGFMLDEVALGQVFQYCHEICTMTLIFPSPGNIINMDILNQGGGSVQ